MKMKQHTKDYQKKTAVPDFAPNGGSIECRIGKGKSSTPVKQGK
jgi:hypothetical protein